MLNKPEDWIGRIARVKSQEQLPSGAYRMPVFISRHEGYSGRSMKNVLEDLKKAKSHSDRKQYQTKAKIMGNLLKENPNNFFVDEEKPGGIVGITHRPTGFRVHLKRTQLPGDIVNKLNKESTETPDSLKKIARRIINGRS